MLSLFKFTSQAKKDFSGLTADMHSHLLPGIDDGAVSVEDSLRLIRALQDMGFDTLYTTPHSLKDIHPNTLETLEASFSQLDGQIPGAVCLDYSSEYFLDEDFLQNIEQGRVRPLPGNRLLIEFSMVTPPFDLEKQFFDIQLKGYQIVLAHPERYLFFQRNFGLLSRLKDMDVEFQVNALALGGYYGENTRQAADKLIKKGWIDFIGTDAHHDKHISALRKIPDTSAATVTTASTNIRSTSIP